MAGSVVATLESLGEEAWFNRAQLSQALIDLRSDFSHLNLSTTQLVDRLHLYRCLTSTNTELWSLVDQGMPTGTSAIAQTQQAGRGQWGRQWQSEAGGLYLSLFLKPRLTADLVSQITFASSWGIAYQLRKLGVPVQIKWPNDLVVRGRKLGGILVETRVRSRQITQIVIGVGLNWVNPVPETGVALHSLPEAALILNLETLAALTFAGLLSGYQHWQQQGWTNFLADYLTLLSHRDRPILCGNCTGTIVGVAPTGELQLRLVDPPPRHSGSTSVTDHEIWVKPGSINLGYNEPDLTTGRS